MKIRKTEQRGATTTDAKPKTSTAKQIAAAEAKAAKILARETEQKESDDRFTPPELIEAIEESFGEIDFDPCWHRASAVRPKAYLDVRQGHNGLRDDWYGSVVFVNPPWSAQDKWIKRAHDLWRRGDVETVVCLVPAATDTKFFHETLSKDADIYFIEGRPHFSKEDESSEATMRPTMIVMFGATSEQKARFAERVRGSWWRPQRASSSAARWSRTGSGLLI